MKDQEYPPTYFPTEIWLHIFEHCRVTLSLPEMLKLGRVSRAFNFMAMEAIFESNLLDDVGYWDPVRKRTLFYDEYGVCSSHKRLLQNVSAQDDTNSKKELFTSNSSLVPSDDFWVMFLTARTLGRIRSKPPTRDHVLLLRVSEHMCQYMQQTSSHRELEDVVRMVCEVAVKHGYIYLHDDFYIHNESSTFDATDLRLDESCAVFRDALAVMAVYLRDNTLLEDTLSNKDPILCLFHSKALLSAGRPWSLLANFQTPIPQAGRIVEEYGFVPPLCGKSLMRLANPVKLAVQLGKMEYVTLFLKSDSTRERELHIYREDIISEVALPDQIEFLRVAIESGRPLTRYGLRALSVADMIRAYGRTDPSSRSPAGIRLSKILQTTTDLDVFNLVYNAILEGYHEGEGVWWTKGLSSRADTLASWGLRRLQRAVLDDCLPIVKRLIELGYSLGPTRSIEDLKAEEPDNAADIINGERTVDVALPIAVKRGNLEMVKLLVMAGGYRKRKNVRKAMRIAMEQGNHEMLEVLASQGFPAGLLIRRAKQRWKKDLESSGRQNMLKWLEMM